jgi:hypothetical protein
MSGRGGGAAAGGTTIIQDIHGPRAVCALARLEHRLEWTRDAMESLQGLPEERRQRVMRDIEAQSCSLGLHVITLSTVRVTGPWYGDSFDDD